MLTADYSKSVNLFRPGIYFQYWHRLGISIAVAKSENEFVAADLNCTMGFAHEPEILKIENLMENRSSGPLAASKSAVGPR